MKKMKNFKTVLSLALALALGFAPAVANAAPPNTNQSVDGLKRLYLDAARSEITINLGGQYKLLPKLTPEAEEFGFLVTTSGRVGLRTEIGIVYYSVNWRTQSNYYVSVNSTGTITANRISPKTTLNNYRPTKVYAYIPAGRYVNEDKRVAWFETGLFTVHYVTVVPEEDLSVYFLGVWSEDKADSDAQHYADYPVKMSNLETQLRVMAQNATKHCNTNSSKMIAYTKTNDGIVRAYFKTYHSEAGDHYYALAFDTNSKAVNKLEVNARDYCDNEYEYMGAYLRR